MLFDIKFCQFLIRLSSIQILNEWHFCPGVHSAEGCAFHQCVATNRDWNWRDSITKVWQLCGMTSSYFLLVPLFLCEQHFSTDGVGSYAFKAGSHIYITAPQAALCLLNERISLLLENISGRGWMEFRASTRANNAIMGYISFKS